MAVMGVWGMAEPQRRILPLCLGLDGGRIRDSNASLEQGTGGGGACLISMIMYAFAQGEPPWPTSSV